MMRQLKVFHLLLLLLGAMIVGGCSHASLARLMVEAPNKGKIMNAALDLDGPGLDLLGVSQQFRVAVGAPAASIAVWVVEPKTHSPRGTILVLHGFLAQRILMLDDAKMLANAGYRTVLVDLRGQGRSTGDYITFGAVEARDVSQVIDELARRKLIVGKIGLFGMSFGAATAIETAGIDPRVQAVVSLASFATMREEIPHFGHTMLPLLTWYLSAQDFTEIIGEAGKLAGFNPDDASPLAAIQRTKAPVLLAHGTIDMIIPCEQARELHAAAPNHSDLMLVPGAGHITLWVDINSAVAKRSCEWFDRYLN